MSRIETFSGTPRQCGASYARRYQREIAGFFSQEFGAYRYSRPFVRSCMKLRSLETPTVAEFILGAARNSVITAEQHKLLMLHEEKLLHRNLRSRQPYCSAVGVVSGSRGARGAVVGQNWDWNTSYYPWASINRLSIKGLPACAGLNSSGLSLMWTGAGYYPPIKPKVGVPTYALVSENLLKTDVLSAVSFLKGVRNAGAFKFLMGDDRGNFAVVEAISGRVFVKFETLGHRSNVYEFSETITAGRQKLPGANRCNSLKRNRVLTRSSGRLLVKGDSQEVKAMISQPSVLIERSLSHATLMQLVADCRKRELHIRSWRQS